MEVAQGWLQDAAAVGIGEGAADPIELGRVEVDVSAARRSEDAHLLAFVPQLTRQVSDVVGHASGRCEVVRRDEADLHRGALMGSWPRCDAEHATARDAAE